MRNASKLTEHGGASPLVPPEHRLSMPRQSFNEWSSAHGRGHFSWSVLLARLFVFVTAGAVTLSGATQMYAIVGQSNATSLQVLLVILFAMSFAWITLSAATALLGFGVLVCRRVRTRVVGSRAALTTRTAIVMPIYNEDPETVFRTLGDLARGLSATGYAPSFDIFVLSDSNDRETLRREALAAHRFRSLAQLGMGAYYRKRRGNEGKKAGNVAEFVQRWGGRYDFMVVLDADSTMTPDAVLALVRAMEAEPRTGLIQTLPQLRGGQRCLRVCNSLLQPCTVRYTQRALRFGMVETATTGVTTRSFACRPLRKPAACRTLEVRRPLAARSSAMISSRRRCCAGPGTVSPCGPISAAVSKDAADARGTCGA